MRPAVATPIVRGIADAKKPIDTSQTTDLKLLAQSIPPPTASWGFSVLPANGEDYISSAWPKSTSNWRHQMIALMY